MQAENAKKRLLHKEGVAENGWFERGELSSLPVFSLANLVYTPQRKNVSQNYYKSLKELLFFDEIMF